MAPYGGWALCSLVLSPSSSGAALGAMLCRFTGAGDIWPQVFWYYWVS